jgi:hypothetical protein
MSTSYSEFLESRRHSAGGGFDVDEPTVPGQMFDFQRHLLSWSLGLGRSAIFADCGLGKSLCEISWARQVTGRTNKPVLILTPLAVSSQMVEEGEKFGIEVRRSRDGSALAGVNVTNYEQLHRFNPADFAGVVCDESSILKNFDGAYRAEITRFMRHVEYRLLATATAAPNDYVELGTSSEALGGLGFVDTLNRFFINEANTSDIRKKWRLHRGGSEGDGQWRFRGHAERPFWKWVATWARAIRKPSDLGFPDDGFILPALRRVEHVIDAKSPLPGSLFDLPAVGLFEERQEQRVTVGERCEMASALANGATDQVIVWCHLNAEGDTLVKSIPDAEQVRGSDSPEEKEERLLNFAHGRLRVLVIKPKIGAFGLNLQNCARVIYFPSHSYEQMYQAVRRCWRFGQKREVTCDIVATKSGINVVRSLERKAAQADRMFSELVKNMGAAVERPAEVETERVEVASWL